MTQQIQNTKFVKIHPNSSCLFKANELALLVLLLNQEYHKSVGHNTKWSRTTFKQLLKMSNDSFSACVNRLEKIGVLMSTDAKAGCKKECSLDISGYNIALRILEATNNREALSKFCDDKFVKEQKALSNVSEEEINALKETAISTKEQTVPEIGTVLMEPCNKSEGLAENSSYFGTVISKPFPKSEGSDGFIQELDEAISRLLSIREKYVQKIEKVSEDENITLPEIGKVMDEPFRNQERLECENEPTFPKSGMVSLKPFRKQEGFDDENSLTLPKTGMVLDEPFRKQEGLSETFPKSGMVQGKTFPISGSNIDIYNNIIISLKEYFKEEFKELNKEIKEDIKKLNKKGYEVSFFTKDKDRGVGEGETKNLQFEVQAQTPSFEEKGSSSPFTPSFEKTEKKDSDAPSIPSFKKEEEETIQSEVPQTPSSNQKFIDMLIRDMMEEYPEGDTPKWMELKKTFSELKEDYFSHDEELSRLEIEDLFPYFESRGCRVGIHYSEWKEKTEEEIREEFMSLPVSENYDESLISLSNDEKIEMIKEDFRESFPVDEKVTLDEMRQFVVEYMRDLELLRIGRVQYDNPQLLSFMFPELQMDKETKLWFRSQNKARGETICSDGGKMIEIQLKFREEAENARKQENPFYKKLERYRFPRISIGENRDCQAIEIIPKLLSDMGYKNGDMEDWDTISQLLDVIIDRYKLYGSGFEPFRGIWVYLDKYDHKQKGKVQVRNLPEK